ncbi:helix-turn-helix domain-containing protein [Rhodococcus sp. T2V]|uniref:helix-turn-helix domain-containing protein n=1 Tax=Rhodococcus sp. T2V TaxID=3034164 RepID=UPI0023E274A7|nr:helix-turn-helix domain-containing protein [Rhodococcus sp. T2V]MDF3307860.1 helix-turn-helix domain-containing protein [Rhodococcus sp. T2V]
MNDLALLEKAPMLEARQIGHRTGDALNLARMATIQDLAERQNVTERTCYYWVTHGKVTAYKIGGRIYVDLDSVDKFLEPKLITGGDRD